MMKYAKLGTMYMYMCMLLFLTHVLHFLCPVKHTRANSETMHTITVCVTWYMSWGQCWFTFYLAYTRANSEALSYEKFGTMTQVGADDF